MENSFTLEENNYSIMENTNVENKFTLMGDKLYLC